MKYIKSIKGHHIVKVIFGISIYITFAMMMLMIKELNIEVSNLEYSIEIDGLFNHMDFIVAKLSYYTNYFALNNSVNAILIYMLLGTIILVYLMDISAGVGRSRIQEKQDKKLKDYYKNMKEQEKTVMVFFDEVEKGDLLQTKHFGIQKVIDIDTCDHSVIIENGLNFYPNEDDTYTYIIK